jgi:competence protein ComEC
MAGWTQVRTMRVSDDWLGLWLEDVRPTLVRVEGVVSERAEVGWTHEGEFARFTFNARVTRFRIEARSIVRSDGERVGASGGLYVSVRDVVGDVRVGDVVELRGMARRVGVASNPGQELAPLRAIQEVMAGTIDVTGASLIERRGVAGGVYWRVARARAGIVDRVMGVLDGIEGEAGVLVRALLLGERGEGYEELSGAYTRAGAAHLLAISGLHLGFVVLLVLGVARVAGGGTRWEWLAVCAVLGVYLWVMPGRVAIVRAGVMALVVVCAWGFGRRYRVGSVVAWAGVLVVVWRPLDVMSAGAQLSFGVVGGLVVLLGWWERVRRAREVVLGERGVGVWMRRRVGELVVVSVGAQAVSVALVWAHFGVVHAWGALGALVLTLLVGVLVVVGLAGVGLAIVVPASAGVVGGVLGAMGGLMNGIVGRLGALPGASVSVMDVGVAWAWCVLGCGWWVVCRRRVGSRERWARVAAVVACGAWLVVQVGAGLRNNVGQSVLVMDTFDAGDGTCHVVRTAGHVLVWDAGSSDVGGGDRLVRAMRSAGVWRVDTLVLTHANLDHYSYVGDVREAFGVGRLVVTEALSRELEEGEGALGVLGERIEGLDVLVVRTGDVLELGGGVGLEIVSGGEGGFEEVNDTSMVGLIGVETDGGERRLLLTGDIEDEGIAHVRERLERMGVDGVDVLELMHHGSARADAMEFTGWIDPGIVVQSTGDSRAWDPRWNALRGGRQWRSTAELGASRVEIGMGGVVWVRSMRD